MTYQQKRAGLVAQYMITRDKQRQKFALVRIRMLDSKELGKRGLAIMRQNLKRQLNAPTPLLKYLKFK